MKKYLTISFICILSIVETPYALSQEQYEVNMKFSNEPPLILKALSAEALFEKATHEDRVSIFFSKETLELVVSEINDSELKNEMDVELSIEGIKKMLNITHDPETQDTVLTATAPSGKLARAVAMAAFHAYTDRCDTIALEKFNKKMKLLRRKKNDVINEIEELEKKEDASRWWLIRQKVLEDTAHKLTQARVALGYTGSSKIFGLFPRGTARMEFADGNNSAEKTSPESQ